MGASFLIVLREGLEAALIVAIILAYLAKTNNVKQFKSVWMGLAGAVVVSILTGFIIFVTAGELPERGEEIFEGIAMLTAVGVLTWMIFWMKKVSRQIKKELEEKVDKALEVGSSLAIATIVFIPVVREGWETALFLFSITRSATVLSSLVGGILGLAGAILLGYSFYRGTKRLNLRAFFNITSILLIFFAAGLLAHGIHELQEVSIVPSIVEHVWDINYILDETSVFGEFFKALFGYNGNPSLVEVLAYVIYLLGAMVVYFGPGFKIKAPAPDKTSPQNP